MLQYLSGFVSGGPIKADQAPWILATLVGIVATACQVSYLLLRGRKVDGMLWLSLFIFVVFGGASIYLHDDFFPKWKPTLIYWPSGSASRSPTGFQEKPDPQDHGSGAGAIARCRGTSCWSRGITSAPSAR